ncbi:hypothetical protein GQ600_19319 [Phytophthora cactorum]|nr:hypothetical protein GQ600_19319 [Phytophthora cactorum]
MRVAVAVKVKELMDASRIDDVFREGSPRVGNLVAEPGQYGCYAGQVPLLAIARMLYREIVTLCSDGIYAVTPGAKVRSLELIWMLAMCGLCFVLRSVEYGGRRCGLLSRRRVASAFPTPPNETLALARLPEGIGFHGAGCHLYRLNPDFVPDDQRVVLCSACAPDPRKSRFSIASGHDYGRQGGLPDLNDVASLCMNFLSKGLLVVADSGEYTFLFRQRRHCHRHLGCGVSSLEDLESAIDNVVDVMTTAEARVIDDRLGCPYSDENGRNESSGWMDTHANNAAIEVMSNMIGSEKERSAVAIRRDKDPVTEWDWNSELIAGAFPCLFTRGGKALPNGT